MSVEAEGSGEALARDGGGPADLVLDSTAGVSHADVSRETSPRETATWSS